MSNFPTNYDTDVELPIVNNNITQIGQDAINALRDAVFNVEHELGLNGSGSMGSVAARINVSLNADGTIKSSALTSLGLVTLPITNVQVSSTAQILESKLSLDHSTQSLYNSILSNTTDIANLFGWVDSTGAKINPHIAGVDYRHFLSHIDISNNPVQYLKNKFATLRDNSNAYTLINDINNELLSHQFADGSKFGTPGTVTTNNGTTYPSYYAHTASGIFMQSGGWNVIPQSIVDLQALADFMDSSSAFFYDLRIQNLYSNGISRSSRSSILTADGYGQSIIPVTTVITHLRNNGSATSPVDDIDTGDDMIEFVPSGGDLSSKVFDDKFALIKIGDIIRVNYGGIEVQHIIKEKKYIQSTTNRFLVRINSTNLLYSTTATAMVNKPLFNNNKFGALAVSLANNNFNEIPSLIVNNPRSAMVLGTGFSADDLDSQHYLLYLAIYTTGNPSDGYTILPGIDVTGNLGITPGAYTLDSVVQATNNAFRTNGFNYRFTAFSYKGEFGIALAEPYNNASFSILSGIYATDGSFSKTATAARYPNNVVEVATSSAIANYKTKDGLGFGPYKGNLASPAPLTTYVTDVQAQNPTKLFVPLKRNNFYVNGIQKEDMSRDVGQAIDTHGDGYWVASIKNVINASGRVEVVYTVPLDLTASKLKAGKTLVVQPLSGGTIIDFGRFTIKSIVDGGCGPGPFSTDITVYDGVHSTGISPYATAIVGTQVKLYFSSDSVSFNIENSSDITASPLYKRLFEAYIDQNSDTFTHERARIIVSGLHISSITVNGIPVRTADNTSNLDLVSVSKTLRGYQFGSVNKISLKILSYSAASGVYSGYLGSYDGVTFTKAGTLTTGKLGEVTRFYDETGIDYVDISFDINLTMPSFTNEIIDIQLFPSLGLDEEIMMLATCQLNDVTKKLSWLKDERQFGNTSEKDLSTSVFNTFALPEKLLHTNGVVRGFDLEADFTNPNSDQIYLKGGVALVNGKLLNINNQTFVIPPVLEVPPVPPMVVSIQYKVNWALCANDKGELQIIPLLDHDAGLGTPTDPNRIFYAKNIATSTSYVLDAVTFNQLISQRKDLTILYIVKSTIVYVGGLTVTTTSLQAVDSRRYVNDEGFNLPVNYTDTNTFGNYKHIDSIYNWLMLNGKYNNKVNVKGINGLAGTTNNKIVFDFTNLVTIDGDNNASLTFSNTVTFGSNVCFKNLNIIIDQVAIVLIDSLHNLSFENCSITIDTTVSVPSNNIIMAFTNSSKIKFKDCTISATYTTNATLGAAFHFDTCSNIKFENTTLGVSFNTTAGVTMPGNAIDLINCSNFKYIEGAIQGNFNKAVNIYNSNIIKVKDCILTSTYNPNAGGVPDHYTLPVFGNTAYLVTNLVNTGNGYVYIRTDNVIKDIVLSNITFNHTPLANVSDRYSFINIELYTSNYMGEVQNLTITKCTFNSNVNSITSDDKRSAISIVNRVVGGGSSSSPQLQISNALISNNICNRNSSIVFTSTAKTDLTMDYPGLVPYNCVIENNTCGSIGYWVSDVNKTISLPTTIVNLPDKTSNLTIRNNSCHYIASVDHTGRYFLTMRDVSGTTSNMCVYPSAYVSITGNRANWIHTGISSDSSCAVHINQNILTSYNTNYLIDYNDAPGDDGAGNSNHVGASFDYAIFVNSYKVELNSGILIRNGTKAIAIISENTTDIGNWIDPFGSPITYGYHGGYVMCLSSNNISNNILKGVTNATDYGKLILLGGLNNIVTGNSIYREEKSIMRYIAFDNFYKTATVATPWDGATSCGIITDNIFDSPYINSISHDEKIILLSVTGVITQVISKWTIERNINQTSYISIPVTNAQTFAYGAYGFQQSTPFTSNYYLTAASDPVTGYRSQALLIKDHETAADRAIGWQENLNKHIPIGARILNVKIGMNTLGSTVTTGQIRLYLNQYDDPVSYLDVSGITSPSVDDAHVLAPAGSPYYGQLDATAINGALVGSGYMIYAEVNTTTIGLSNPDISDQFVVGFGNQEKSLGISLDLRWHRNSNVDFVFSPVMIKYRW